VSLQCSRSKHTMLAQEGTTGPPKSSVDSIIMGMAKDYIRHIIWKMFGQKQKIRQPMQHETHKRNYVTAWKSGYERPWLYTP
jgi:hypothetical protein